MIQFVQKCKEKFFPLVRGGGGKRGLTRGLTRGLRRSLVKSILTFSREKSVLTKVVPYDARSLKKIGLKLSQNGGGEGVSTQSTIIIVLFFFFLL